jgi:DNA-binding NarL/FixJ family response regulator
MTSQQVEKELFEFNRLTNKAKENNTMKVFIADDSPIIQERLMTMLSDITEVEIVGKAHDTPEAIKSIKELKPDVVILDNRMPGGGGIEVLQSIKKDLPRTKVIVFTNYPYTQYRKKFMELGADFFFSKSIQFEEIANAINELNYRNDGRRFAE